MPAPGKYPNNTSALRLRRFINAVLKGMGPADAYVHAGYKVKNRKGARASGSRMLARPDVQARLQSLRLKAESECVLSLHEKRVFLKAVVVTPVSEVSENDAICAKVSRTTRTSDEGTVEKVVVVMPDKLRAMELDARLAGELVGGIVQEVAGAEVATVAPDLDARLARVYGMMLRMPDGRIPRAPERNQEPVPRTVDPLEDLAVRMAVAMAHKGRESHSSNVHGWAVRTSK